tara:strand:- start:1114 stop:1431 length:318 start_codon:yes stop_codon:yes gene_type:complete
MTIETIATQINFVNPEKDNGAMTYAIQRVYDLTLEIQSAQEAIGLAITDGFEIYKDKIDDSAKKGDYTKFLKKAVSEILDGKVTEEVETLQNILDQIDIVKKNVK